MNNREGHRKHITTVLHIAGMMGGSEERKGALLPHTLSTAEHTGTGAITVLVVLQHLYSAVSDCFTSASRWTSSPSGFKLLDGVVEIHTEQQSTSLSQENITVESQTSCSSYENTKV